jgi:hypothetical protein
MKRKLVVSDGLHYLINCTHPLRDRDGIFLFVGG